MEKSTELTANEFVIRKVLKMKKLIVYVKLTRSFQSSRTFT